MWLTTANGGAINTNHLGAFGIQESINFPSMYRVLAIRPDGGVAAEMTDWMPTKGDCQKFISAVRHVLNEADTPGAADDES